jgi:chorismate dehydratase
MKRFTVGSVPYVNAIPLVEMFEEMGSASPVNVVYRVPSQLPELLQTGEASAILVSSVDALRVEGRQMAEGICIGSHGAVKSVRLFSKVPFDQISTLALDSSSMTSNRLAIILLKELYRVIPAQLTAEPALGAMLEVADACVLIGDIGMMSDGTGLYVLDLGSAWLELTGLPFVWAAWIGNGALDPELVWWLQKAAACAGSAQKDEPEYIRRNRQTMVARAMSKANWPEETARDYFENVMAYQMDADLLAGLEEFKRRLVANGFDDASHFPEIIQGQESLTVGGSR